jgi:hypothetical protein
MTKTASKRQIAADVYATECLELINLLGTLTDVFIDQMPAPDSDNPAINWATVGTVREVRRQAMEMIRTLTGEEG